MTTLWLLAAALLLDAALGDPSWLWKHLPHPVAAMGRMINWCDQAFNNGENRRSSGMAVIAALVLIALMIGVAVPHLPYGGVLSVLIAAVLLAHRSLVDHVAGVARGLADSLPEGRRVVAKIVGRDVQALDDSGVARASIESAAENFSDGVIAPAFWLLIGGVPGLLAYKMVNTADSMIGYRNDRYAEFGWAAARLDDVMNFVPARVAGALIALAARSPSAVAVMARDARLHRSPNAGWPEAAMAGALGVALSGPRAYEGQVTADPFVNSGARKALNAHDIWRCLNLLWRSWAVGLLIVAAAVFWSGI